MGTGVLRCCAGVRLAATRVATGAGAAAGAGEGRRVPVDTNAGTPNGASSDSVFSCW